MCGCSLATSTAGKGMIKVCASILKKLGSICMAAVQCTQQQSPGSSVHVQQQALCRCLHCDIQCCETCAGISAFSSSLI
jgi:hypothetical protein